MIETQINFCTHFALGRHAPVPDRKTILLWVTNFRATGSALKRKPPGRPRSARTPENIQAVRESILRSPRRAAVKHTSALHLSEWTVRRILHANLKFCPYKMIIVQEFSERYWKNRRACCNDILQNVPENAVLITSGKAHFHLCGSVNKQNFRYWAADNPRQLHERPLHSPRVAVWCAAGSLGVWGPYFFEERGATVTITTDSYIEMLRHFLEPKLRELQNPDVWFQQDGATAHTATRSKDVLRKMFPGHLISLRGDVGWPARSPDLALCDFFLWGYLKSKVFEHRPQNTGELKEAIRQEIAAISPQMTARVMQTFRNHLQTCIEKNGRHLDTIIFKTKWKKTALYKLSF